MRVGIGLPTGIPNVPGHLVIQWAHQAEAAGFSSLGVVDRVVYDSYDPLIALAAAAAVTQHIQLATTIVIGPLHNTPMLAKVAASLDAVSNGRLVLGLAVGARKEDYDALGIDYRSRGKLFVAQVASLHTQWENGAIGGPRPVQAGGPSLLIGGLSDQVYGRIARYANGYVHGGGPPKTFARAADKVRAAWRDMGRLGTPQLWAQGYFALGEDAIEQGLHYMRDYYAFTGPFVEKIAAGLLTSPQAIAQFIRGYEEAGCDELVLFPTVSDINQLERLAHVLQGLNRLNQPKRREASS